MASTQDDGRRLLVARGDLHQLRWVPDPDAPGARPLADGQLRLQVEHFALTANNITYAAFGEAMKYWQFFPADDAAFGCIPVWGFAPVQESRCEGIAVGERIYGFLPMATHLVLAPQRLSEGHFVDGSPHREKLPPAYNLYVRVAGDALHRAGYEDLQLLLRPVFITSFLIDDFLDDESFFGATRVLLSSASSKTAWSTALHLKAREGITVVGFTSAPHRAFCEGLGCYDRVRAYQQVAQEEGPQPCVYVDFSGDAGFRATVHRHFPELRYSCAVGGTHVGHLGGADGLPGPRPTLFFAPDQVRKRQQDWGPGEFGRRAVSGWRDLLARAGDPAKPWLQVQRHEGGAAVLRAWQRLASGDTDPAVGHMASLQ